jgi:TonB family protein
MTSNLSTNRLPATHPSQPRAGSADRSDVSELAGQLAAPAAGATSADLGTAPARDELVEEFRLTKLLEEARLVTGATGAAIALARGAKMACVATTGPDAPDLGTYLDASTGLSGCCIQTRQLQQCSDTEIDPRVAIEACRCLGVRSIVVVPLMDSGELFGVFEILSSRANAFSQGDLFSLQVLADRILEFRRQGWKAPVTRKDFALDPLQPELPAHEILPASAKHDTGTRRRDYRTGSLTAAVVALSVLLGWMMGRAGWDRAVNQAQGEISTSPEQLSDFRAVPTEISPTATNSDLVKPVEPEYSEQAKRQPIQGPMVMNVLVGTDGTNQHPIQGPVVMNVLVGTDGSVRQVKLISGDPQLVEAVADAVRRWRFQPHSLQGQPVEFETRITVKFALP